MENEQTPDNMQERFLTAVRALKLRFPVARIAQETGYKSSIVSEYLSRKKPVSEKFVRIFAKAFDLDETTLVEGSNDEIEEKTITYGEQIRRRKAIGNPQDDDDGLIAVPIGAQAGGAQYYDDPVYASHLEVYKLPGMPYRGAKYRLFQVDGDSMEYMNERGRPDGLVDRMWIVTQKIDPIEMADHTGEISRKWKIDNYYIYVIVEPRRIRVKRLYQFPNNDTGFVVISDNPDWPQEWLPVEEVQELWLFKRKLDWDASPPKMFDITIEPPNS